MSDKQIEHASQVLTADTMPIGQVDEVHVEDFTSFFNHTFSRPNAPDDKNWDYSAGVTKEQSEIELDGSEHLLSEQRGNYPPGSEAIPGVAFRVTSMPTGGSVYAGYFDDTDDDSVPDEGFGFGADASGTFAFIAKEGTVRRVYQADWNGPASVEDNPFDVHYPRICRFPHLFYGGGAIEYRIIDHGTNDQGVPETEVKTVHIETPETVASEGAPFNDGPPFGQPNLPIAFTADSVTGGALRANAAHYESGDDEGEKRVNGEHFAGVTVGTTGWTPLLSWRKRTDWEMVNVRPLRLGVIAETNNIKLELQLGSTLNTPSWGRPTHTDDDETAVEVDTSATIDTNGQRRWVGFAPAGQGNQGGDLEAEDLEFNLPTDEIVTLAGQAVGGEATAHGAVGWQEFF